ncbi:3-oxoacyl-[acyl-carrier-protein] synthase III C-terminal domain-containing protein [Campylobacter sp. 19-13652]|uniref:3-oxoacyl-[acyl-carrier-protein] synthase III C-terminal domain-containing protein n=1 Tax=Campylobacter sp. 19-13652 TaxID=2840180 RepID=UPI001C78B65D|nr:3-oxoacyl-[acyl-carrier-protein] synthase III C-terminal domain-containing protein [Campylobacter sp. 19-13652]BCX80186.1 putative 3-oxoacyl-[acyl-carrier-protein] synthase 3 [Campylobacter sp. 19-13652]
MSKHKVIGKIKMSSVKFTKAKISAVATCVPEFSVHLRDECDKIYGGNRQKLEKIIKTIKLDKRHIVRGYTTASDLSHAAATELFNGGIEKDNIDALICVTQTPDFMMPSNAAYLHGKLGLSEECSFFDVNQGCAGYVYGLWLAFSLIESGAASKVLLLVGDTISRTISQSDTNLAPLIGDGASATVIEKSQSESYFEILSNGEKFETIIRPNSGFRNASSSFFKDKRILEASNLRSMNDMYMDGAGVFDFVLHCVPPLLSRTLKSAGKSADEIDFLLLHQANEFMLNKVAKSAGFSEEQIPQGLTAQYGNLGSASIPAIITHSIGEGLQQDKRLSVAMAGFGVGLSWAGAVLELDGIYTPPMVFLKE